MRILSTTLFLAILLVSTHSYATPKLFGKSEQINYDIGEFPKWEGVLDKKADEFGKYEEKCEKGSKKFYCNIKDWLAFIDSIKGISKEQQLREINSFANKRKYTLDINNWGVTDYWESPGEFLFKNGDCEDYAIVKYMSLKQLGFDTDDLRIVVLMDNNLQIYHSILAVYIEDNIFILDNQLSKVTNSRNIYHYSPVYSINESHWWRHI